VELLADLKLSLNNTKYFSYHLLKIKKALKALF